MADAVRDRIGSVGWTVVPEVLDGETVARARGRLERILVDEADIAVDRGWRTADHRVAYALPAKDRFLLELVTDERIVGIARRVLGDDCVLAAANGMDLLPGGSVQELHRDHPDPVDGACVFLHIVCALDHFTEHNGATRVVGGSHRGAWQHGDAVPGPVEIAEVPAGGAVVYDGAVVHGAGANRTRSTRFALHLFYSRWWARPHWDFPAFVPDELLDGLGDEQRRILGFDDRPSRFDLTERRARW